MIDLTHRERRTAGLAVLGQINDLFPADAVNVELELTWDGRIKVFPNGTAVDPAASVAAALGLTALPVQPAGDMICRTWVGEVSGFAVNLSIYTREPIHTGAECACGEVHLQGVSDDGQPMPTVAGVLANARAELVANSTHIGEAGPVGGHRGEVGPGGAS